MRQRLVSAAFVLLFLPTVGGMAYAAAESVSTRGHDTDDDHGGPGPSGEAGDSSGGRGSRGPGGGGPGSGRGGKG